MQNLFAFEQSKEANYQLALDLIDDRFKPDLNSMEVQDKNLLRQQNTYTRQLFEKQFQKQSIQNEPEKKLADVADEALRFYQKNIHKDQVFFANNIIVEIQKLTLIYHRVLGLMIALAEAAASDKKSIHSKLLQLPFIKALQKNESISQVNWNSQIAIVRDWMRELVKKDAEYEKFIQLKEVSEEDEKLFLKYVLRKIIFGNNSINDYFDELDIHWVEDKSIIKSLADKTLKSYSEEKIELQKILLDWEDDKSFIEKLFTGTVELKTEFKELIANNTKNWEVDRLPLTDRVILEMAVTEMITFPSIPIKVTINEYIELAKEYSTPNSRQFINGILDVMAKKMKESGAINKSGRGLIDNK